MGYRPLESIECVGSEQLGLSQTSYCALSETTRVEPAFNCFVINWTIGLINGCTQLRHGKKGTSSKLNTQIVSMSWIFSTSGTNPGI